MDPSLKQAPAKRWTLHISKNGYEVSCRCFDFPNVFHRLSVIFVKAMEEV